MSVHNSILPIGARVTTTDGTATTAATFATRRNTAYVVNAVLVASDGSTTASYGRVATFENNAGTLTQVGSTTSLWTHEDIANPMDAGFDTSGTDVRVRVTGDPGRTIKWNVTLSVHPIVN